MLSIKAFYSICRSKTDAGLGVLLVNWHGPDSSHISSELKWAYLRSLLEMVAETALETKAPAVIAGSFSLPLLHHGAQEHLGELNTQLSDSLGQKVKFAVHPPDRSDKETVLRAYDAANDGDKKQKLLQIFKDLPARSPVDFFCTLTIQGITRPLRLNPVHSKHVTVPAGFQHGPQVGYMPFPRPPPIKATVVGPSSPRKSSPEAQDTPTPSRSPETPDVLDIDQTTEEQNSSGSDSPPLPPTVRLSPDIDEQDEGGSSLSQTTSAGPDSEVSPSPPPTERIPDNSASGSSSASSSAREHTSARPASEEYFPSPPMTMRGAPEREQREEEAAAAGPIQGDAGADTGADDASSHEDGSHESDSLSESTTDTSDSDEEPTGSAQVHPQQAATSSMFNLSKLSPLSGLNNAGINGAGEPPLPTSRGAPKGLAVELAAQKEAAALNPPVAGSAAPSATTHGSSATNDQEHDESTILLSPEALNKLHYVVLRKFTAVVPDLGDLDKYHRKEDLVRALHGQALPIAELTKLGIDIESLLDPDIEVPPSPTEMPIPATESTNDNPLPATTEEHDSPREKPFFIQEPPREESPTEESPSTLKETSESQDADKAALIDPAIEEQSSEPQPSDTLAQEEVAPAQQPDVISPPPPAPVVAPPAPAPIVPTPVPPPASPAAHETSTSTVHAVHPSAMIVSREDLAQIPMEMLRRIAATQLAPGAWKQFPRKADLVRALVIKGVTISALEPAAGLPQHRGILPHSRPVIPTLRAVSRAGSNTSSPALSPRNELRPGTELLVYRVEWRKVFGVPVPVPRRVIRRTPGNTPGTTPGTTPRTTPR